MVELAGTDTFVIFSKKNRIMGMLLFYLLLALGISFLCSILESVILSVNFPFIYLKVQQGHRSAQSLKKIKNKIDRPLAAILTLNTVAHTIGAAGVGSEATRLIWGSLFRFDFSYPHHPHSCAF